MEKLSDLRLSKNMKYTALYWAMRFFEHTPDVFEKSFRDGTNIVIKYAFAFSIVVIPFSFNSDDCFYCNVSFIDNRGLKCFTLKNTKDKEGLNYAI